MLLVGLLVLLIMLGGAAQDEATAPGTQVTNASLTVTDMRPLSISGRGFKPNERVVVSTGTARKSVTANVNGRFVVRFPAIRCAGGPIRAVGAKGSRATTRPPKVLCVEP